MDLHIFNPAAVTRGSAVTSGAFLLHRFVWVCIYSSQIRAKFAKQGINFDGYIITTYILFYSKKSDGKYLAIDFQLHREYCTPALNMRLRFVYLRKRLMPHSTHLISALLLGFFLASHAYSQATPPELSKKCPTESKYDRFEDKTTLICGSLYSKKRQFGLFNVSLNASFKGQQLNSSAVTSLVLISQDGAIDRTVSTQYGEAKIIYILTDAYRLELPVTKYTDGGQPSGGMVIELAAVNLSAQDIRKLKTAKTIEGRWANTEFILTRPNVEALVSFLREIQPEGDSLTKPSRVRRKP